MSVKPFKVDVSTGEVARLKRKLQETRLPDVEIVPDAGDNYGTFCNLWTCQFHLLPLNALSLHAGVPLPWVKRLHQKFIDLDWTSTQNHLNRLDHSLQLSKIQKTRPSLSTST